MSDTPTAKGKAKRTTKPAASERPATKAQPKKATGPAHSVPVLVPEVHVHRLPLPQVGIGHVPVPRVHLPVPDAVRSKVPDLANNRLVWYGGLAGLATVGAIAWPVAGVVAAGVYVAEHRARAAMQEDAAAEENTEKPAVVAGA